jgi:hypothetical protein
MAPFEIRPAVAADLDAIAAGFARECAKPVAGIAARLRWAFASNPAGWTGFVAARGAEVVAHLGASHVPVIVSGRPAVFARVFQPWVAPPFRVAGVHGLFGQLDDHLRQALEAASIDGAYGIFVEHDWWTLRRLRDFEPVRTELVLVRPASLHRPAAADGGVVRVTPESAALLAGGIRAGECHAVRDASTVAFRTGGPYRHDAGWMVVRDGRAAGLAIFRDSGARRTILDLACPADDEACARALFDAAIGDGSREVALPWFSRSPWWLVAQRLGFRAAPFDLPFLGFRSAGARIQASWLMRHWHVGAADVGLGPPPRMLATEETVTTAPAGTRTAKDRT